MAPPKASQDKGSQPSISSFFQPPSTASSKRLQCEVIELSSDDDDDELPPLPSTFKPTNKKLKLEDPSALPPTSSKATSSSSTTANPLVGSTSSRLPTTTASERVSKWRFDPSAPSTSRLASAGAGGAAEGTSNDASSRLARSLLSGNMAWKKSTYLQNPNYMAPVTSGAASAVASGSNRRREEVEEEERGGSEEEGMEVDSEEEGDSDSEEEPASSKGKGKGKGKAVNKGKAQLSKFAATGSSATRKSDAGKAIKFTPLEQQVIGLKKANPGVLLAIEHLPDQALQLTNIMTGIACFKSQHMLVASVPTFRLNIHVKRLINAGMKVGIVKQMETAALKKIGANKSAPFTRSLSALYTSATWVDDLNVEDDKSSESGAATLLCLVEEPKANGKVLISIISVVPGRGEIIHDSFEDSLLRSELETRILHLQPSELLLPKSISKESESVLTYYVGQGNGGGMTCRIDRTTEQFKTQAAVSFISDFYTQAGRFDQTEVVIDDSDDDEDAAPKTSSNGELHRVLDLPPVTLRALAHLVKHLNAFKLDATFLQTQSFVHFSDRASMNLSGTTLSNLEILRNETDFSVKGSLLSVLDHCRTGFSRRMLKQWLSKPLLNSKAVNDRLDAVEELKNETGKAPIVCMRQLFQGLPDLERGLVRVNLGRVTTSQELFKLLQAFQRVGNAFDPDDGVSKVSSLKSPLLQQIAKSLPTIKPLIDDLLSQIDAAQARDGSKENLWKNPNRFEDLGDARDCLQSVEFEILQELASVRKILRKPNLEFVKVGEEEFLIELRIAEAKKLNTIDDWIKINSTKVVYRFRTPAMQKKIEELQQCRERLAKEAERAFSQFLKEFSAGYESIRAVIKNLATVDCLFSFAAVALLPGYTRPIIVPEIGKLEIRGGRNPVVEQLNVTYVPNDVSLGGNSPATLILTGLNAGGKSSTSKMIALLAVLAQVGCFVPAESMTTSIFDQIHTRFGASDEIARGRSTFMVELSEASTILRSAGPRSLIILDELGRGTSTNDGLAIASACLQYIITTLKSLCVFVTHYPSLAELEKRFPRSVSCYHMSCIERENKDGGLPDVTFLFKLTAGLSSRSMGINVAKLAGLPQSVLLKALAKSKELENSMEDRLVQRRAEKMERVLRALIHEDQIAPDGLLALCSQLLEDSA